MDAAQVVPRTWAPEHVQALLPSVLANPWPLAGPIDVLGGATLYEFTHGRSHAYMAVRPVPLDGGRRLDVVGLVSDGERLRCGEFGRAVLSIAQAHECAAMAMCTQRAHVVRGCMREGWKITGMVMARNINVG